MRAPKGLPEQHIIQYISLSLCQEMTTFEKFTSYHGQRPVLQQVIYIWQCMCVCVCVRYMCPHSVGATELKFSMELKFGMEKIIAIFWAAFPPTKKRGAGDREVRMMCLWENFKKQKLKSAPDLVGAVQVRSGQGPHPGVWQPVQVQGEGLLQWSLD